MTLKRTSLAVLGLLLATPVVLATWRQVKYERAFSLVRLAATAHERVSYAGEAAWRKARWGKTVAVAHDAGSGRTRYSWGPRFAYVTKRPNSRSPDPAAWCLDLAALESSYRATERDATKYLGRPARLVVLESKFKGRPSVQLTIDAATNLPLKVATYAPDGMLYRVASFKRIEIGPQTVEEDSPRWNGWGEWFGSAVPLDRTDEELEFSPLVPDYLPEGFRQLECRISGRNIKKLRLVYSDGVTTFEMEQGIIPTPAQVEDDYVRRFGRRRVGWFMRWYMNRCKTWIMKTEGGGGKTTVLRHSMGPHGIHRLKVGRVEVKLTSRSDLAAAEPLKVLRSLRIR